MTGILDAIVCLAQLVVVLLTSPLPRHLPPVAPPSLKHDHVVRPSRSRSAR